MTSITRGTSSEARPSRDTAKIRDQTDFSAVGRPLQTARNCAISRAPPEGKSSNYNNLGLIGAGRSRGPTGLASVSLFNRESTGIFVLQGEF
jgi:hypothetical protein